ncbi:flagellar component of cell-proximal portion of basal-body rod [Candidatus Methylobacter favarea]|uniref:Flagellar basal-body rod protein FlgF n=1 Tax=Candidatus Methylobacter favarea TaxID=2707345 RepID=A0A8S0WSF3_9GAMM|nr:flagellar basal-body rod protein FlgF [Candidatus Methylobacter favarea]CAA9892691.1 flagellar component of cell-proximal portion of basal-body rod [Candidatus Methylobacter favarea]
MDRSLYIAMSGAKQTLLAQTANANNLANSQTTGFKSDLEQFRSMPVFGSGFPSRVYAMTERPGTDFSPGAIQTTGRELDVAINGEGWFAVQGADGSEAYTRAGDLRVTPEGLLQTSAGLPMLGQNGPASIPPAQKLTIGEDGTISIIPLGSNATTLAVVDRIKMVKPAMDNLEKHEDGLLHLKDGKPLAASAGVSLVSGALEASNVNAIQSLVEMIELARNFELQTRVMKTTDENSGVSSRLMQMA